MAATTDTLGPDARRRWTHAGTLGALAIVLGYLETFVPIPIPGVKLGLANIAVLIALAQGERRTAVAVAAIKVLASGLLFGNPVTMAYSAAGTALSLAVMLPLSYLRTLHLAMLSTAGAVFHEAGQLLVAQLILGTPYVWYSAPLLLVAGVVTGALCGAVATRTVTLIRASSSGAETGEPQLAATADEYGVVSSARSKALVVAFVAFVVVTLRASGIAVAAVLAVVALCACALARVGRSQLLRALRPVLPILVITLVAQLASLPPQEAAKAASVMALRLVAITTAGVFVAVSIPKDEVKDLARWMLSPFEALGASVEGPVLALDVAMRFVPVFAERVRARMADEQLRPYDRTLWTDVLPGVVAELYW